MDYPEGIAKTHDHESEGFLGLETTGSRAPFCCSGAGLDRPYVRVLCRCSVRLLAVRAWARWKRTQACTRLFVSRPSYSTASERAMILARDQGSCGTGDAPSRWKGKVRVSESWLRDYTILALRVNKALWQRTAYQPVEEYQPPEWEEQVRHEPIHPADLLLQDAQQLQESLPLQPFEPKRSAYLTKQLCALETMSRRLLGERFSLQEQARRCYDLDIDWLPESLFEQAHALYSAALPGRGSISSRLQQWQNSLTLPPEKAHLLPSFVQHALMEALLRTQAMLPMPADTNTEIQALVDRPARAMARYLGNHRSRVYLNPAVPFPLTDLFYVLCHEGYPGHLAEFVLKDEVLIHGRGYLDERVLLPCSPRYVISEGLALLAHEMIFGPGEAEAWLTEHIYPEAGIDPDHCDLTKIHRARDLLFGVSCNASWLVEEGRPEGEVLDYLMRYGLLNEEAACRELAGLQQPFYEANIYTYFHGRRLLAAPAARPTTKGSSVPVPHGADGSF